MRVVLFGPWPPPWGGVAVYVRNLRDNLCALGMEPIVYGFGGSDDTVKCVSLSRSRMVRELVEMRMTARRGCVFHDNSALLAHPRRVLTPMFVASMTGVPKVITVHDSLLPQRARDSSRAYRERLRDWLRSYRRIIAVDDNIAVFLLDELGLESGVVVRAGSFLPSLTEPEGVSGSLASWLDRHHPVLMATGALVPHYDLLTVGEAFLTLRKRFPDIGLLAAVNGFASETSYSAAFRRIADACSGSLRVVSDVPHGMFLSLLDRVDVFIRGLDGPESLGLSRIEALLRGVPTVATQSSERTNLVIYRFGSPESLVSAVECALSMPRRIPEIVAARYRELAAENLSRVLLAYREALEAR